MAELIISGPAGTSRSVSLDPKGATLGREPDCSIVLDHNSVSRHHARIFCDPFGRWIIEDLQSQNGVFVEGRRIIAQAILPNQQITIRPFTLSLVQEYETKMIPHSRLESTVSVIDEGLGEEVVSYKPDRDGILSAELIHQLNELTGRLLELHSPSELYAEACRCLAKMFDTLVAFVRLAPQSETRSGAAQILACHFGWGPAGAPALDAPNLHLSRRVLDAVRSTARPVMAKSEPSQDRDLVLTIVDEATPHVVFSAPISDFDGTIDVLYLDIVESRAPNEMFDFLEAVASQINFAHKSLILSEARTERSKLDQQLALAHDIQSRLIPQEPQLRFAVDVAVCYQPAMWVGGDYYDVWALDNGQIAFAVGDVSGKGLPAAMIMANLQAALRTTMTFCIELSKVAEYLNRHLCQSLQEEMFVTLFLGLFDPTENRLAYVNAGHIQPLIKPPAGAPALLGEPANPPLGLFEEPFEMSVETIAPNTGLLVVTDGITEAGSPQGEQFEMCRLTELVARTKPDTAQDLVRAVTDGVDRFRQNLPPHDDITIFAMVNRTSLSDEQS
ncbi:MAG TPA: SpoIIE family protein phosphatase [Sedimentisphaerales bacterium]|nr:SpoIIE family protein phosphatase [Sedimentisphaerales bacterium]